MKVLLDENLDHALRKLLGQHEVVTTAYMGWSGLKNGELLRVAEENGIEILVTGDQTINYELNLAGRRLAIVALSAIQLPIIRSNLPAIVAAIDDAVPGSFQVVECGTFSRRKPTGEYAFPPWISGAFRSNASPSRFRREPHFDEVIASRCGRIDIGIYRSAVLKNHGPDVGPDPDCSAAFRSSPFSSWSGQCISTTVRTS